MYGITQNAIKNEYMIVIDAFSSKRNTSYGICSVCSRYNTSYAWCQSCDPERIIQGWTSENKDFDNYIQEFQLNSTEYEMIIEWILFEKLENFQNIGKEISSIFSAVWLDGIRTIEYKNQEYIQIRKPTSVVELVALSSSQISSLDFLNEVC